jgi:type II secretory pathway component PulC
MRRATPLTLLAVCLAACGGSAPQPTKTAAEQLPAHVTTLPTTEQSPTPSGTIRRSVVRQVMSDGLGAFLQRVTFDVEHPVFRDNHFVGFRITELNGDGWGTVELQPGDVITAVNGFSIERPEQAEQAFLSLAVASELRVDYERDGQPRSMRLNIIDD